MRSPESRPGHRPGKMFEEELNLRYLSPGAFTILSPDDHGIPPEPPHAPPPYRLSPQTRRNKNQAFSIIAEPVLPRSRSPSPNGRVSPFRGRGFNPAGSRHASPASSPPPPPEDTRIHNYHKNSGNRLTNSTTALNVKKSQIPQLKREGVRRSQSIIFTDSDSSPKFRRKNGANLKPQLSKSLNYIGPKGAKPPPSPRRHPGIYTKGQAFSRLSPIIGSSPEPSSDSKSQSSPISKIPKSRSTPASRKQSPTRDSSPDYRKSRINSRGVSRNNSRNPSRESSPKPPFSPTRIPVRSFRSNPPNKNNINAKTTPNQTQKVPTKTEIKSNRLEENNNHNKARTRINRKESLKNVSKPPAPKKYASSNNNNNNNKLSNRTVKRTATEKIKKDIKDNNNKNSVKKNEKIKPPPETESEKETTTHKESGGSSSSESPQKSSKENDSKTNVKPPETTKPQISSRTSSENTIKKVKSVPKLTDMLPSATTVVSTTTTTVTQPLKIEAKFDTPMKKEEPPPKETPMYMDEGRVLSAKSVSSAIERMNDTVLDSHTLLKDRNVTKLSPAASAIISLSNDGNQNVTAAVPNVEQNSNVSNWMSPENNVKNNINKLISPDDSFGAKVNNHAEKSANERIVEARTMVASDVKPIRITVKEKPSDVEVQSGNVRFPPSATNGISTGTGVPPPQVENGNQQPEPPKTRCQILMDKFRNKMPCACCQPKPTNLIEEEKTGCFNCLKKKKKETEEIIVTNVDEVEEAKKSFLERLKCCRSNKVEDSTTGCCGRGRKESWVDRRDSILSTPPVLTRGQKCKNFFKALLCCCGCYCCPSRCCKKPPPKIEDSISRRASMLSKKKSLTPTVLPPEEPKNKLDSSLVEYTSTMKAAIPVLPVCLAYFCLIFNVFAPGTGTVFSGLFCLCMGIPRFSQKDSPKARFGSFLINIIIGCGQLFTVLFCLVGWGWSIWWGTIMLKVAKKHRKLKRIEKRMEQQQEKSENSGNSRKDVEKGRS